MTIKELCDARRTELISLHDKASQVLGKDLTNILNTRLDKVDQIEATETDIEVAKFKLAEITVVRQ